MFSLTSLPPPSCRGTDAFSTTVSGVCRGKARPVLWKAEPRKIEVPGPPETIRVAGGGWVSFSNKRTGSTPATRVDVVVTGVVVEVFLVSVLRECREGRSFMALVEGVVVVGVESVLGVVCFFGVLVPGLVRPVILPIPEV